MGTSPSQPPRLSSDGNWYWDGQRWVPMPRPTPSGRPTRSNLTPIIAVTVVAVVLVGAGLTYVAAQKFVNTVLPQRTISVSVTDDRSIAINGATVEVQGSGASAKTEATGVALVGLGSLNPGIYTLVAIDSGYINSGAQFSIPESGNPPPVSIQMSWAPPLGTFVWHWKSTEWDVMVIGGGNPDYSLQGYAIEWHCYGEAWSKSDVSVSLGRDQLTFGSTNVPIGPGAISTSWVSNGALPDTSHPAPAGTCVNGQNAW